MAKRRLNERHEEAVEETKETKIEPKYYVMRPTDNVSTIVSMLDVSIEEFCKNNNIEHIGMVRFGRKYKLN